MAFEEYTGEIITTASEKPSQPAKREKRDEFARTPGVGFTVPEQKQLSDENSSDWWKLPAAFAAGSALASGGIAARRLFSKEKAAPAERIEPTMGQPVKQPAAQVGNVPSLDDLPEFAQKPAAPIAQPATVLQTATPAAPINQSVTPGVTPAAPAAPQPPVVTPTAEAPGQPPAKLTRLEQQAKAAADRAAAMEAQKAKIQARLAELEYRPAQTAEVLKYASENPPNQSLLNTLYNQHGPETAKVYKEAGLGPATPFKEGYTASRAYREGKLPVVPRKDGSLPVGDAAKGGGESFGKAPPNWMEHQRGRITPTMAAGVGLNALGALGLAQEYKEAKKTGDYSSLGLNAAAQALANIAGFKPNLAFGLMQPSAANANEKEELAKRRKMKAQID